jgi:hypothetical protein
VLQPGRQMRRRAAVPWPRPPRWAGPPRAWLLAAPAARGPAERAAERGGSHGCACGGCCGPPAAPPSRAGLASTPPSTDRAASRLQGGRAACWAALPPPQALAGCRGAPGQTKPGVAPDQGAVAARPTHVRGWGVGCTTRDLRRRSRRCGPGCRVDCNVEARPPCAQPTRGPAAPGKLNAWCHPGTGASPAPQAPSATPLRRDPLPVTPCLPPPRRVLAVLSVPLWPAPTDLT